MRSNKIFKFILLVLIVWSMTSLVRINVTAKKEQQFQGKTYNSALSLELSSDIVQDTYKKLSLLDGKIKSPNYKDAYFDFDADEKELTEEEKLYSIIENIYKENKYIIEENDGSYLLEIPLEELNDKSLSMFGKEIDFSIVPLELDKECGILDYSFDKDAYKVEIKECKDESVITKTRIENATRKDNFIDIEIKAFHAINSSKKIDRDKKSYKVSNFNSKEVLTSTSLNSLMTTDDIFDQFKVDTYKFSFELNGDEHYLTKIEREKRD